MIRPPVTEFIATLKDAGYVLRVEDGRLKVIHPTNPLNDTFRQFIKENKPSIIQALQESPGLADTPAQDDDWRSAIPRDTMRRYIEKEQSTWTPERRQTHEDEIRRIQAYRQQRGPVPSGPATGIPRAEVFAAIGAVMERLSKIWPSGLDTDPAWQDTVNEAAASGDRKTFLDAIRRWEQAETARVEIYMAGIRREVSSWPDEHRQRFSLMVKSFQDGNRGTGITVRGLSINQAIDKAFHDLRPFVPDDTPTESPTPNDDLPFHDMSPATREILLRHWRGWDVARRQRFVQDVEGVMKRTGYSEGNAAAFILQTAGPVAPGRPRPCHRKKSRRYMPECGPPRHPARRNRNPPFPARTSRRS